MNPLASRSYLRKRWGKVPSNMVQKLANECSKGVDWVGSTKGDILNAYVCSVLWNEGKIVKEKCNIMYRYDPVSLPFNPDKFQWLMDRVQVHMVEMEMAIKGDCRFEKNNDRWAEHWTK